LKSPRFDEEVVRASEESAAETAQVRSAMIKQREVKDETLRGANLCHCIG